MLPTINRNDLARGYPTAVLSALFLSTTAPLIRYLTVNYHVPALVLAFWRDVFVTLTVLTALWLLRPVLLKLERRHWAYLALYGLMLAVFNSMWTLSVALNGAAVATVLAYCSAAFTALLAWQFLKETLGWVKLATVVLCLAGCALVAGATDASVWRSNLAGIMTGVLAGLCYAIYSLMGRSASQRGLNPWTTLVYTFATASVCLLAFNLLFRGVLPGAAQRPADLLWLGTSWGAWGILVLLAAVPTVAGFGLYNISLSLLPSSVANLILTMEPAFTAVLAYFFLGEHLTGIQIVGSLVILSGVVLLRVFEGRRPGKRTPESSAVPAD